MLSCRLRFTQLTPKYYRLLSEFVKRSKFESSIREFGFRKNIISNLLLSSPLRHAVVILNAARLSVAGRLATLCQAYRFVAPFPVFRSCPAIAFALVGECYY